MQTQAGLTTQFPIVFPNKCLSVVNYIGVVSGVTVHINVYIIDAKITNSNIFTWAINETPDVYNIAVGY